MHAAGSSALPVGEKLRRWRELQGLSIQDVADLSGVSASMLSRVETGHRGLTPLLKARIAKGLGVRIVDVFGSRGA